MFSFNFRTQLIGTAVDEIVDAGAHEFNALLQSAIKLSPSAGNNCIGRRGAGIQIVPPRPIELRTTLTRLWFLPAAQANVTRKPSFVSMVPSEEIIFLDSE